MSCPVCESTMQNLGVEGQRIFWCPRCGTLKVYRGDHEDIERPRCLERVTTSIGEGLLIAEFTPQAGFGQKKLCVRFPNGTGELLNESAVIRESGK